MSRSAVVSLHQPQSPRDALSEVLRSGARQLLAEAVEAEVQAFLSEYRGEVDEAGRARLVRNGYLPEREIQTGLGGLRRPRFARLRP